MKEYENIEIFEGSEGLVAKGEGFMLSAKTEDDLEALIDGLLAEDYHESLVAPVQTFRMRIQA